MSEVVCTLDGAIGRITLNRPDRMNAINIAIADKLKVAVRTYGNHPDVHAIVIRGAGGNFCAGGDFTEVERLRAAGPAALRALFKTFHAACQAITDVDVPVVVAVEGVAMAGGFELMQAADIVLVSDNARIADNHINFGMIPGGGSTVRLPRNVGRQVALALMLSGERLSGADAVARGLAYRSFPAADFEDSVETFVRQLAERDRGAATRIKRLVLDGLHRSIEEAVASETDAVVEWICGPAGSDGVTAFQNREVAR